MRRIVRTALTAALLATPLGALAQEAYVIDATNIYAGPDTSYPLVASVYGGTQVDVEGCTEGWEWCDVIVADNRGWIPGDYLQYQDAGQPVLLPQYAPQIGIPVVAFSLGLYWDRYYRYRPFYRDRDNWYHRPPPRRPPPPPPPRFHAEPYRGPVPGQGPGGRPVDPYHVYGPYRGDPRAQYPGGAHPPAVYAVPGQRPPPPHPEHPEHPEHPHDGDNNNGH